ncbi:Hypothetical predicted protein, partial [Marmota monax]
MVLHRPGLASLVCTPSTAKPTPSAIDLHGSFQAEQELSPELLLTMSESDAEQDVPTMNSKGLRT